MKGSGSRRFAKPLGRWLQCGESVVESIVSKREYNPTAHWTTKQKKLKNDVTNLNLHRLHSKVII
jgi:hypothetical protein